MRDVKIIPKDITERIWARQLNIFSTSFKIDVLRMDKTTKYSAINMIKATAYDKLFYTDLLFDEEGYFVVKVYDGSICNYQIVKVGTTANDYVFNISNVLETLRIVSQTDGVISNNATTLFENNLYFQDITSVPDGDYIVSIANDSKKLSKPIAIKMNTGNSGKILLEPGFNLIGWSGSGYGTWSDKTSASVSKVSNSIAAQLNEKYGTGSWRGCRTYDTTTGSFQDYINNFTPNNAFGDFSMIITDGGFREIVGIEFFSLHPTTMELEYW